MSRGKRYNGEKQLNMKKVFAVFIAIVVLVMFFITIGKILNSGKSNTGKNIATNYFSVYTNGKWGIIDSYGNTVIEPSYDEMIIVPDKTKAVFICTYEVNYEDGSYKVKAVNEKNEQIFTSYDSVEVFENYDSENKLWFEEGVLKVKKDNKYGMIDLSGAQLLSCDYDDIYVLKGVTKSLITVKDGKFGLTDNTGSIIIENEYATISALTNKYEDGYIVKSQSGKFGIINTNKQTILECSYDDIKHVYGNDMYVVKTSGTWKIINKEGLTFLDNQFADVKSIDGENVLVKKNGKYGVLTIAGEVKIEANYEDLTFAFSNYYIAKKDNKMGIIDINNSVVVEFNYASIEYNKTADCIVATKEDGTVDLINRDLQIKASGIDAKIMNEYISIKVENNTKYYNFKFEEKSNTEIFTSNTLFVSYKDGKYGFVDKSGNVVVDYQYDNATEQNDYGFVCVEKDGKWGAIDQYGKVVVEPTYDLSKNKNIDFIGKWHLAEDLNANYYTDR